MTTSSKTMAEIENKVLSGLSFWELSEEELIESNKSNNDLLVAPDENGSLTSNLGYKNDLAAKVVERMALERKYKMTLNQECESIKDKFKMLEKVICFSAYLILFRL
jgi:hypothetical protein